MAKLNKHLHDHFPLPILLKPIGNTSQSTILHYKHLLHTHFSSFQLNIDQASQVITYFKDILQKHPTNTNPHYKIKFISGEQGNTEWPELELSYKSQFVIGISEDKEEDIMKIKENLARFRKQLGDERREQVAIFLLKADKETYYKISVDKSFVFMPDVMQPDLVSFLQMQMNKIVKEIVFYIGEQIKNLQMQQNEYIVFNKNEEKPQQRTLKKKKKGRCCKIIGDYCLMVGSEDDALEYYKEGFELLKRLDDYLWMMAIEQGRAAAYLVKYSEYEKGENDVAQDEMTEYLTMLTDSLIQSIQHSKKSKIQLFIIESYFIAFHALSQLNQKSLLQQWVSQFIVQHLKSSVLEDQAIYLSEIGLIYKRLAMLRKCNYYFFLSAQIYLVKQPDIARMFLLEIKNNSPAMKQWTKLYSLVLKELIKSDPSDAFQGHTYAELLDVCHNILPQSEIYLLTQKLNFSYFEIVKHEFEFLKLVKFNICKPNVIPKLNRLVKVRKEGAGVLIAPRKKQEEYKYEANEDIKFDCEFVSEIRFPISLKLALLVIPSFPTRTHNTLLEVKSQFSFQEKFSALGNHVISALSLQIWNYQYDLKLPKPIAIQVYQQHSHYQIVVDDELIVEKSSEFGMEFKVVNEKPGIQSCMVKMNISIYYSLEVGLQENIVFFSQQQLRAETITVECKESQNESLVITVNPNGKLSLSLSKFKVHREYLKKVQITLEYIRTETSKYQINVDKMIPVKFREKILFEITGVRSESKVQLLSKRTLPVWQKEFTLDLVVSKHDEDKKVYEIELYGKDGELIAKRILGDQYKFIESLKLPKAGSDVMDIDSYLLGCASLHWRSMTTTEHGVVPLRTQGDHYPRHLLKRSPKEIHISYSISSEPQLNPVISINNYQKLLIQYKIISFVPFTHRVYLESIEFKETSMVGYVMEGKNKVGVRKEWEGEMEVEFCCGYRNRYVVVIEFDDEVFVAEEVVNVG